jgi:hypothetical protein
MEPEVTLTVGHEQVLNFTLQPSRVAERVEVQETLAAVETTSATVSELVDSQKVRALPLKRPQLRPTDLSAARGKRRNIGGQQPQPGQGSEVLRRRGPPYL